MIITPIAKFLRMLRLNNNEVLKDMADKLGLSTALISSIETGKKKASDNFREKVINKYNLSNEEIKELDDAIVRTNIRELNEVTLKTNNLDENREDLAVAFARYFSDLDEDSTNKIKKILEKNNKWFLFI